jgi:hypothetical protein
MPASIAGFQPSTAAVRNTRAVSSPGVMVSKPTAQANDSSACSTFIKIQATIAFRALHLGLHYMYILKKYI